MTVNELAAATGFCAIAIPEPNRELSGVYIGDLLSWVMGRAQENQAWITIMSNINVIAVASLSEVACVILAEGVTLAQEIIDAAESKGVNVLKSDMAAYETALALREFGI